MKKEKFYPLLCSLSNSISFQNLNSFMCECCK